MYSKDFKQSAKKLQLKSKIVFRTCPKCGYDIGYVFKVDRVFYDGYCKCHPKTGKLQEREWLQVAHLYHRYPTVRRELDKIFKLK